VKRAVATVAVVATCATLAASATSAGSRSIKIGDDYFVRPSGVPVVAVTRGTRVTWRWTGSSAHDVRVSRGPIRFHSRVQTEGTYSRVMSRRGTYKIYCEIHGAGDQSMVLRVK
jgi:plastocyanin